MTITPTANCIIALSDLSAGMSGNISVVNPGAAYTIHFHNLTTHSEDDAYVRVASNIRSAAATVTVTASGYDCYSWYYDGTYLFINGTKGYGD
jgi:hypothetical protein